jgi:hypothetical protein
MSRLFVIFRLKKFWLSQDFSINLNLSQHILILKILNKNIQKFVSTDGEISISIGLDYRTSKLSFMPRCLLKDNVCSKPSKNDIT